MAYHRRMANPATSAGFFAGRTEQGSKVSLQVVADPGAASRTKQGSKGRQPLGGVWGVPTTSPSSPAWGVGASGLRKALYVEVPGYCITKAASRVCRSGPGTHRHNNL